MLKFEKINKGKTLRISAINPTEFAEYIKSHEDDLLTSYTPNSDQCFIEMTESYWTNGWNVTTADNLGWLSECLVVSDDAHFEDEEVSFDDCRIWTNIHNYQIVNPLDQILEKGFIDFYLSE